MSLEVRDGDVEQGADRGCKIACVDGVFGTRSRVRPAAEKQPVPSVVARPVPLEVAVDLPNRRRRERPDRALLLPLDEKVGHLADLGALEELGRAQNPPHGRLAGLDVHPREDLRLQRRTQVLVLLSARDEPAGLVARGQEYEDLCAALEAEILTWVNVETGKPAVRGVLRPAQLFEGPEVGQMPDLLVEWQQESPIRSLASPTVG